MKIRDLLASVLLGSMVTSAAWANNPAFDYISAHYTDAVINENTYDGFEFEVSGHLNPHLFLSGTYSEITPKRAGPDLDIVQGRLGYIFFEAPQLSIYTGPLFQYFSVADDATSSHTTDLGAFAGFRYMLTPAVELNSEFTYINMTHSLARFSAGAQFYLTRYFALSARANFVDWDGYNIGFSFHF